ncbi:MAG: aspartate carbamoyltransferase regulatory subunit [Spirochaetes bacterium]|nr:aspartate carbamoyltransferase regulatory subunit [Spirochaetota bacterium]
MKELKVDAIKCGTVIDHIPPGKVFKVIDLLGINEDDQVMIGTNLGSPKFGRKDVIKIENRFLSDEEINSISLVARRASISIIEDFKPCKKSKIEIPDTLRGILVCPNRHCVTNNELIPTLFTVEQKEPLLVRCDYCERIFGDELHKCNSL